MSNYVYGDNLNGGDNKEPININLNGDAKAVGIKRSTLIIACAISIVVSLGLGILGGFLFSLGSSDELVPNEVVVNNIQKSPFEQQIGNALTGGAVSRADIVDSIAQTVVEVRTDYVVSEGQLVLRGAGSGIIAGSYAVEDKDTGITTEKGYYVITNAHVIEDAVYNNNSRITVTHSNSTKYNATVAGYDIAGDIAILKIKEAKELKCAVFANDGYTPRVGDEVIAVGNPFGQLGGTVTNGYISALNREISVDGIKLELFQTDAPVNRGNSGGGLFNLRGELVGIVNARNIGTSAGSLGFVIPISNALDIFEDVISLGYVTNRPTIFAKYDMELKGGLFITEVEKRPELENGSNGDNSELLREYDQICGVIINGEAIYISSAKELDYIICSSKIGSTLTLLINRMVDGTYIQEKIDVTVFEYYH
ncbi:MAG: trypsin-like peptidase domain-containing protein [Clostridia bacterium]|nr:trypsin-like peptidase domain-containing protein [Clostridia bacterium]